MLRRTPLSHGYYRRSFPMRQLVLVLAVVAASLVATPAFAQRGGASVLVGWTFSDGVTGDSILAGDGNRYDRVDPKDSFKWGFDVGGYTSDNVQGGGGLGGR